MGDFLRQQLPEKECEPVDEIFEYTKRSIMHTHHPKLLAAAIGFVVATASTLAVTPWAFAASASGTVSYELAADAALASDETDAHAHFYGKVKPDLRIHFGEAFSVRTAFEYAPQSLMAGEDSFFEDHGVTLEALHVELGTAAGMARAGEYAAGFGMAHGMAPGLYGGDFAKDYELSRRMGVGGVAALGGPLWIAADAFEPIGESGTPIAFASRAGARNLLGGMDIEIGLRHGVYSDETGVSLGVMGPIGLGVAEMTWLLEGAYLDHAEGGDESRTYVTAGLEVGSGAWRFSGTGAVRDTEIARADALLTASAGYALPSGLALDVGWRYVALDEAENRHTLGARVGYEVSF